MMTGLIIKDILNLKNSLKMSFLILIFFSFMGYKSQDPTYLMSVFILIVSMQSISTMSYDDLAKWDTYALTMPISREKMVISKYILSFLLAIVALMISGLISYFIIVPVSNLNPLEFLLSAYSVFSIAIILLSVMLPLIYKYGVEKSRMLLFVVVSVPILIGIFFNEMGLTLPNENQIMNLFKASPFIIIMIVFISYFTSCRIYKNKEM